MQQKKWFAPLRTRLTDVAMRTQKHARKGQVRTLMGTGVIEMRGHCALDASGAATAAWLATTSTGQ
jgi:hypothetical protein